MTLSGQIVTVGVTVLIAAFGGLYTVLDGRLNDLEEEVDSAALVEDVDEVESMAEANRRMAESAYMTVHGNSERPEDEGLVVDHDRRLEDLEERADSIEHDLEEIKNHHGSEINRLWRSVEAIADETGTSIMMRGDD